MPTERLEYKLVEALHTQIEDKINSETADGWRVVRISAGGPTNFTIFALLERRKY